MRNFVSQLIVGVLGIWLATKIVPEVGIEGNWKSYLIIGIVLGIIIYLLKPLLDKIAWPLKVITLNLFTIVIIMFLLWIVDIFFTTLVISGLVPLFWSSIIIWVLSLFLGAFKK